MRKPIKTESLKKIRTLGVPIGTVVDVGILSSTVSLIESFPDVKHLLIEPIVEWNETIEKNYNSKNIDYELINVAASDRIGSVNMATSSVQSGKPITHAYMIGENPSSPKDTYRTVPVETIDSIVAARDLKMPFLLKIDVDGAELSILKGSKETLKKTNVVVVEANMQTFIERSKVLVDAGFRLFDVVDLCYYDDRLAQVDLIFLRNVMIEELGLEMYKGGFQLDKWKELS